MLPIQKQQRLLTQILVFDASTSVTKPDFIAAAILGPLIRYASHRRRTGLFQSPDSQNVAPNFDAVQVHKIDR